MVLGENLALYYAWVGDVDATLKWMRRAAAITTAAAPFRSIDSRIFDPVRADPEFASGVEAMKKKTWERVNTPPASPHTEPNSTPCCTKQLARG
jgi:hypothetical protein